MQILAYAAKTDLLQCLSQLLAHAHSETHMETLVLQAKHSQGPEILHGNVKKHVQAVGYVESWR